MVVVYKRSILAEGKSIRPEVRARGEVQADLRGEVYEDSSVNSTLHVAACKSRNRLAQQPRDGWSQLQATGDGCASPCAAYAYRDWHPRLW
jgi:hypothetical protein